MIFLGERVVCSKMGMGTGRIGPTPTGAGVDFFLTRRRNFDPFSNSRLWVIVLIVYHYGSRDRPGTCLADLPMTAEVN